VGSAFGGIDGEAAVLKDGLVGTGEKGGVGTGRRGVEPLEA
jgi:hypothetical protein